MAIPLFEKEVYYATAIHWMGLGSSLVYGVGVMSDEGLVFGLALLITINFFLFAGDPDLHDAVVEWAFSLTRGGVE